MDNVLVAFQSSLFVLAFKQFIYEVLRGGFFFLQCVLREALSFFDLSSNVFHCFGIILSTISCSNSFGYLVSLVAVIKFVLDYFPLVIIVFYTSDKIYTQFLIFFT